MDGGKWRIGRLASGVTCTQPVGDFWGSGTAVDQENGSNEYRNE